MSKPNAIPIQPNRQFDSDVLLVELSLQLLDGVRDRVRGVQKIEGENLISIRGSWHGKKIVVASFAECESYAAPLKALVTTHHPNQILMIGEGNSFACSIPKLPLVYVSKVIDPEGSCLPTTPKQSQCEAINALPQGSVADGSLRREQCSEDELQVVTSWLAKALAAVENSAVEASLLVAISCKKRSNQPANQKLLLPPPCVQPRSMARELGKLWGKLRLQPKEMIGILKPPTNYWKWQRQIADQIELIIEQLPEGN